MRVGSVQKTIVLAALAGAISSCGKIVSADSPVELVVDARSHAGRVRPIWDEINLWKLQLLFGVQHPDAARWWGPDWMKRHLPWVRYGRVLTVVGGNYAPEIAPWCDRGVTSPEHPDAHEGECGKDGVPGWAAENELVRTTDGSTVVDYTPLRTAVERLLTSGIRPHLNLSAAPSIFTGHVVDFSHYHWNAEPVRDLDAWRAYVDGAFRAIADLQPRGWRVSIINEPNCLTLVGWQREVRHIGFNGTPEQYGLIFTATAETVRKAAPGVRLHAGNYVTSATFPGEENLAAYLGALRDEMNAKRTVAWSDLDAISLSLYETRDTSVYEFVPVRLARLTAAQDAAGLPPKPIKVDELEVHPGIIDAFNARGEQRFETTLYAASWHAEALRAFIDDGRIVSVAPWFDRMLDMFTWHVYPKYRTYQLFGLLAGQLDPVERDGAVEPVLSGRHGGLVRVDVSGQAAPPIEAPHLDPVQARSVGALATRQGDVLRMLVVHHQNEPLPDAAVAWRRTRQVRLTARNVSPGAYTIRHLSIGGPDGSIWNGSDTTPLRWVDDGCRVANHGTITIDEGRSMSANTVWLFEARRRPRCPR